MTLFEICVRTFMSCAALAFAVIITYQATKDETDKPGEFDALQKTLLAIFAVVITVALGAIIVGIWACPPNR